LQTSVQSFHKLINDQYYVSILDKIKGQQSTATLEENQVCDHDGKSEDPSGTMIAIPTSRETKPTRNK
jgi:hypothetical protein